LSTKSNSIGKLVRTILALRWSRLKLSLRRLGKSFRRK
jgi:hypothetical protein